ncbi:hypothetical protein KSF78_0009551, partial [Schistosoma japonicum]
SSLIATEYLNVIVNFTLTAGFDLTFALPLVDVKTNSSSKLAFTNLSNVKRLYNNKKALLVSVRLADSVISNYCIGCTDHRHDWRRTCKQCTLTIITPVVMLISGSHSIVTAEQLQTSHPNDEEFFPVIEKKKK